MDEDYCEKLWKEKLMDEEAEREVANSVDEGCVAGLKWGLIIFVPMFAFFILYMETHF